MGAITPEFVVNLETNIRSIIERDYARLTANLWWQRLVTTKQSVTKKDVFVWLLSTAQIRDLGEDGGNMRFDDLASTYTETVNRYSGAGLKLTEAQMTDLYNGIAGGEAMALGSHWAADIGAYTAYWPQKQTAYFMKNAHTASLFTAYDGKAYFAADHLVNPARAAAGSYHNLFTGAASGSYPGALPIDESVSLEVALQNLGKLYGYISGIKMPNGEDPRMLRPMNLFVSPRLFPRAVQLTNAKFIAQVASSGAGTGDVEGLIAALGYATPIQCDEFAGFESDTTYFASCSPLASTELGAAVYVEREPFSVPFFGPLSSAEMSRKTEYEWHCRGRNGFLPGHPYMLHKVKGN